MKHKRIKAGFHRADLQILFCEVHVSRIIFYLWTIRVSIHHFNIRFVTRSFIFPVAPLTLLWFLCSCTTTMSCWCDYQLPIFWWFPGLHKIQNDLFLFFFLGVHRKATSCVYLDFFLKCVFVDRTKLSQKFKSIQYLVIQCYIFNYSLSGNIIIVGKANIPTEPCWPHQPSSQT